MPPEAALESASMLHVRNAWSGAITRLMLSWAALFAVTWPEWGEMIHQWWDIDTYGHIVLIPPILAWLVGLRRPELAKVAPAAWWPGLIATGAGLALCLGGRVAGIGGFSCKGVDGGQAARRQGCRAGNSKWRTTPAPLAAWPASA